MKMVRRDFLKNLGAYGFVLAFFNACTKKETSTAPESVTMVSEDNATAKALKYVKDASRGDPQFKVAKQNIAATEQFCHNCMFYKSVKENEHGICQLLQPGYVTHNGWCMSWSYKAPKAT